MWERPSSSLASSLFSDKSSCAMLPARGMGPHVSAPRSLLLLTLCCSVSSAAPGGGAGRESGPECRARPRPALAPGAREPAPLACPPCRPAAVYTCEECCAHTWSLLPSLTLLRRPGAPPPCLSLPPPPSSYPAPPADDDPHPERVLQAHHRYAFVSHRGFWDDAPLISSPSRAVFLSSPLPPLSPPSLFATSSPPPLQQDARRLHLQRPRRPCSRRRA